MHFPAGNATDPIWRVLASSLGISSSTPWKPQHSIPCWLSVQWEPSACRTCQCCQKKIIKSLWVDLLCLAFLGLGELACFHRELSWSLGHSSRSRCHCMAFFPSLKHSFIAYRSSNIQIAFLKFTSCDNQTLLGCIPIAAVAVYLKLK